MGCGWDGNELDGKIFEGWDADGVGCRWLDGTNRDADEDRKILEGMEMQMGWHVDGMGKNQSKVGHDACDAFFTLQIVHVGIEGMS